MKKKLHIFHVATEMAPIIKVGGMADVTQGLCFELAKKKHNVEIFLPKYKNISKKELKNFKLKNSCLITTEQNIDYKNKVFVYDKGYLKIHLIDPIHPKKYFFRDNVYEYPDDISRFLYFSKTVFSYLLSLKKQPDILHLHDWHTSILALLYKEAKICSKAKVALTIHNLSYQGKCRSYYLKKFGIDPDKYMKTTKLKDDNPKRTHTCNLLKGGIVYSDIINVVSPTYAKEILSKKYSCDLLKILKKNKNKISGILNGIDNEYFNPQNDPYIFKKYSTKNTLSNILLSKKHNKELLRKKLGFCKKNTFLVSNIGRLVFQKGPSLIKSAIFHTLKKGGQFILLGSSHEKKTMKEFKKLKLFFKNNKNVHLHFEYNESLAHLIYSASDFIIIPSRFEPCGLTQMISMRYGTIPVVRETGGLKDTVFDVDNPKNPKNKKNGYTFIQYKQKAMNEALDRAFICFLENSNKFNSLVIKNMHLNFSWEKAIEEYLKYYNL